MCFFSYLSGSCTYFLISCFLTTHLTHPWKVDSLFSPLTPDGHCSQSLLATRTTCCPSGVKGRNFLPLHYIISRFRFCRVGLSRPSVMDPSSVMELGCASPVDRARLGKNGIRKMGFGKTGFGKMGLGKTRFEKNGSRKTGFDLQAHSARPGKNWIISVCALQLQLQSYKRMYVCPELTCLTCFCL